MQEIKHIEKESMSDKDIKEHLGQDARIVLYSDLDNYNSIEELLPNEKSFIVLLYQDSQNTGHWTGLIRFKGKILFFDSYGEYVDDELKWVSNIQKCKIGVKRPYLTELINASPLDCLYNKFCYQSKKSDIATCGRHVCFFLLNCIHKNKGLKKYYELMQKLKKKMHMNYDEIVSYMIN